MGLSLVFGILFLQIPGLNLKYVIYVSVALHQRLERTTELQCNKWRWCGYMKIAG